MKINASIIAINFFIISIILFGSNYLLLLEDSEMAAAARSMQAGVSICSPLVLGLDCQVSGLISCVPSPTWIRKSSSEGTRMASAHAIIEGAGQRQRWRLAAGTSGESPARCRRCRAGALALAVAALVAAAGGGDQRQQFSILEHSRPASVNCWENVLNFHDCY